MRKTLSALACAVLLSALSDPAGAAIAIEAAVAARVPGAVGVSAVSFASPLNGLSLAAPLSLPSVSAFPAAALTAPSLAAAPAAASVQAAPAAAALPVAAAAPAARASLSAASVPAGSDGKAAARLEQVFTGRAAAPSDGVDPGEVDPGNPEIVKTLPDGQVLRIKVAGEATVLPPDVAKGPPIVDETLHDVVIVGGGYSGLSAAWHLRDKDVLLIEREPAVGGLAYQGQTRQSHVTYARGAAYYTEPSGDVKEIYDSVGMTPIEKTAIKEPIDSYYYKGEDIKDVWSKESLKKLPKGFARFLKDLKRMDKQNYFDFDLPEDIPEKAMYLQHMTLKEFLKPYGPELTEFLDSYTQSALGGHVDQVAALGFLLFYKDEIVTRYTWPGGTGGGSNILANRLQETHAHIFRTQSHVREVLNMPDGTVRVTYEQDGKVYVVKARRAVVATPLKVAAKIVPEMPAAKRALVAAIKYADYVVHSFFSKSDLFKGGYDTWFPSGKVSFTDVIAGRWVETEGYTIAHTGPGILTVYMPMAPPHASPVMTPEEVAELAAKAAVQLRELIPGLAGEKELTVESYRWPSSIHLTPPGYMTETAIPLSQPDGAIHYANNNLGTPSFEVALLTGRRAALRIREVLGFGPPPGAPVKAGGGGTN